MNGIFMPMFIQGMAGVSRRLADGGQAYAHAQDVLVYNEVMSWSAWLLAVAQIPFIINIFRTMMAEREASPDPNPWQATTIEWTDTTSPPLGHGNFEKAPVVHRGPYEYSVPEAKSDYSPQTQS
jgi:cytochrome c oxidase subunit 1